ncbi:MAG: four helix bundle protein [Candidatus Moraniibacteriota bacterium]
MPLQSFKELIVWQRSMELVKEIYRTTSELPQSEMYGIVSQMRRAAISIASNIAEGRHRGTRKDFLQFLRIAYASGAELETQVEISMELGKLNKGEYEEIAAQVSEIMRMLNAMIKKLKVGS